MERLTQALAVNEIKYIRHRETTSHLYLFLSLLAQARKLNRAGLKGTFHRPGVHLCSPRPSSSVRHVQRETEPSQRQQIPKNFSFGPTLLKWKVLARKSPSCICKGTARSSFLQITPGLERVDLGTSAWGGGDLLCQNAPWGQPCSGCKEGGGRMEPRAPRLPWGGGGLQAHEADFLPADFGALGHWGGLSTWASTHGRQRGTQLFAAPCGELQSESHGPTGLARR